MKSILGILTAGLIALPIVAAGRTQNDSLPALVAPDIAPASAPTASAESVRRAVFATQVVDREPIGEIDSLSTDAEEVCFFTEIVGLTGGSITHRWIHDGEALAEVTFDIGGPRWRVYSKKALSPDLTGTWSVEILDGSGRTIETASFFYHAAPAQSSAQIENPNPGWDQ